MIAGGTPSPKGPPTDAFANAVVGDKRYIVRGSRGLNGDRADTRVGPIQVVEPAAEAVRRVSGLDETVCAFEMDGQTGYGPFELACFGPYRPYGFP